jgi:hypothetical protein
VRRNPWLLGALGVLLGLLALAAIGRAEAAHRGRDQSRAIGRLGAEIGPLDSPSLDSYRYFSADVQCLLYRRGGDPFALELCIDERGRVIEAIDRRTAPEPRIWSLRDDPSRASVRVDRADVNRLLEQMGVPYPLPPARP